MHIPPRVLLWCPRQLCCNARNLVVVWCALLATEAAAGVQRVEMAPELGEAGREVVVTVRSVQGEPVTGVTVQARPSAGTPIELGKTDDQGTLRFWPEAPGRYEIRVQLPDRGSVLIAPYQVRAARWGWPWALVCVSAGLALLWLNLRRWRRTAS